jgi:hypothetical protein
MSCQVADNEEPHRCTTAVGALFIDRFRYFGFGAGVNKRSR